MNGRDRYELRQTDGKRIRVVDTATGREEGIWNHEMQEWFPNERERYELLVEPAHASQEIACPGCGETFHEMIREDHKTSGILCPGCGDHIVYVFDRDRGDQTEDETEQATLVPDGGVEESGSERTESVTLVFQDWCDWCRAEDVELTHKIDVERMDLTVRFCSLECAARWGCAADQDRIEERSLHTGGSR